MALLVKGPKVLDCGLALNDRTLLSQKTDLKSGFETAFRESLEAFGIRAHYEPFRFSVTCGNWRTQFTPDFVTDLRINGRRVLLEPHGMRMANSLKIDQDLTKFGKFLENYGRWFYLVVASNLPMEVIPFRIGHQPPKFADEYWFIDRKEHPIPNVRTHDANLLEEVQKKFRGFLRTGDVMPAEGNLV